MEPANPPARATPTVQRGAVGGRVGLLGPHDGEKKELSHCDSPGRCTSRFSGPEMSGFWCFSWWRKPTGPAHPRAFPRDQSGVGVGPRSLANRKNCFGGRGGLRTGRKRGKTGAKITKNPENPALRKPTGPNHLKCSHNFLSVIFGFLVKFYILIYFFEK